MPSSPAQSRRIDPQGGPPPPSNRPASLEFFPSPAAAAGRGWAGGVFLAGDGVVIAATIAATVFLGNIRPESIVGVSIVLSLCSVVGLYLGGCYDERVYHRANRMSARLLFGLGLGVLAASTTAFFFPSMGLERTVVVIYHVLGLPALVFWRRSGGEHVRARVSPTPVAVLGRGPVSAELVSALSQDKTYRVDAEFKLLPSGEVEVLKYGRKAGRRPVADIPTVVATTGVQMIAVSPAGLAGRKDIFNQLINCKHLGVEVKDIGSCTEMLTQRLPIRHVDDWWVALSFRFLGWGQAFDDRLKRAIDIFGASLGLLLSSPILLIVAVAVRLTSGRPVLFRQERVGLRNQNFVINKFRTMVVGAERMPRVAKEDPRVAKEDPRITRLGRFLRKSHFDELPQLWNVLRGDMSLVGPRPAPCQFVPELRKRIPYFDLRHIVRPGITGLAQVEWVYCQTVADNEVKVEYDLHYVRYRNTLWDMWILLKTLLVALKFRGSEP